eukprot:scaffold20604_cov84-Skeletonema_marinoi.AAC.1
MNLIRLTISQLLIFCITPFAFNAISCSSIYYGKSTSTISTGTDAIVTEEPQDAAVSFPYNTVCIIKRDYVIGSASTNCPPHKLGEMYTAAQGNASSLAVFQQLLYELLAAAVTHVISPITFKSIRNHIPRSIKKQFPGMNCSRWKVMSLALSKNACLRDIFFRCRRKISIADYVEMVGFSLKAEVVFQVSSDLADIQDDSQIGTPAFAVTVLIFRMCHPFEIHTSFDQILFCYIEIIFDALVLFVWRLIQRMALSWQLIKVSASKYKRIRSNKSRSPSSWKLLVLTLMSYPQLVVAPRNTPAPACSDSSVSMITAVVLVMIATAVSSFAIIMSGTTHRRRAPRLKEASPDTMKQHRADCMMRQIVPMIRCKSSRSTSRKLLVLLLLSYPALVAAPHTSSSVGASSLSTSTSVAAASVGIGAICYAHRTRKWTRDESRLEEKCRQSGVMYTPPESNETEQDQTKRRSRLAEECRMEQSKRRRIKNADAQKKKRKSETPTETAMRQSTGAEAMKEKRSLETPMETAMRQSKDAEATKKKRESETPEKRQ